MTPTVRKLRAAPGAWRALLALALLAAAAVLGGASWAGEPAAGAERKTQARAVDDAWRAALPRDPVQATRAYLDRLPAEVLARSAAYAEGGYWLLLWNWLVGIAASWLLLATRPSTALRDWAARRLRPPLLRDAAYGVFFVVAGWLLALPLTIYQGFVREHAYGLSTQTFGAWMGEQFTSLAVQVVIGALAVALLYAVLRRAGRSWWLWATVVAMAFLALVIVVAPLWIDPLFNTYRPLPDGEVKSAVLAMARANGVPADNVYVVDASRQTTRISGNVAGLLGTAQVRLNDNLLNRSSLAEIRAVMGHEIGHYALNHVPKILMMLGLVTMLAFVATQWAMDRLLARWGPRWRLAGVADVAALPLLVAVFSTAMLIATPLANGIIRTQEVEADLWSLNLSRDPLALSEVLLELTEYRKPDPGPLEEFVFYDHPSTQRRIFAAMRWREQMLPNAAP